MHPASGDECRAAALEKLFRRDRDADSTPDTNQPLYSVLHDLANPELSFYAFRDIMQGYLAAWARAYAEIARNARGEVTALWPLDPARMTVTRDSLSSAGVPKGVYYWIDSGNRFNTAGATLANIRTAVPDGRQQADERECADVAADVVHAQPGG